MSTTHARTAADQVEDQTTALDGGRNRWRVVDIVVAAVLGVAVGLLFILWNYTVYPGALKPVEALLPGLGGLLTFGWLLGGPLGALVIRKPGAALLVEVLAAIVSMAPGTVWGNGVFFSGVAQGLGAELVFLAVAYRRWSAGVALVAGVAAAVAAWANEYIQYNWAQSATFNITYLVCLVVTGLVTGVLAWTLMKGLANSGALDRFAAGREARAEG